MAQGRGLGPGRVVREKRSGGRTVYVGHWTDSARKPHRKVLGTDRRVATRRLAEIVRKRDLAEQGMAVEGWAERPLPELQAAYLADLSARCSEGRWSESLEPSARVRSETSERTRSWPTERAGCKRSVGPRTRR